MQGVLKWQAAQSNAGVDHTEPLVVDKSEKINEDKSRQLRY